MRVISGKARGSRLRKVPGDTTRPIMDRVKESLFNILGDVSDERWLDLFAGTGQVGIEALSRGAAEVVFIDKVRPAIKTIEANLQITKLGDRAQVVQSDAFAYLSRPVAAPFDLIYVAPPQYLGLWQEAISHIDEQALTLLAPKTGIVVVQIDPKEFEQMPLQHLLPFDSRTYGNTLLWFLEQMEAPFT